MRKLYLPALLAASLTIYITGCTTANPAAKQDPTTGVWSAPPYIADPRIVALSNQVAQVSNALSPVNPYAGITNYAVTGGFGLFGLIAGAVAAYKNRNAVIATMADGIVKAGAGAAVIDHASTVDQHFATIATAVNSATGANQTATGSPKTA